MQQNEALPDREVRLAQAEQLVAAIRAGDAAVERRITAAIGRQWTGELHRELARMTRELREVLGTVRVTDELSRLAHRELPNAHLRLTQVLELTEEAAHRTLGAVEESLPAVDGIAAEAKSVLARWPVTRSMRAGFKQEIRALLGAVATASALLKVKLSDVLLAQGYQDITGQIMRPVVKLVAELEAHLINVDVDTLAPAQPKPVESRRGNGPVLRGLENSGTVSGQDDVDDLLSRFGM